MGCRLRDQCRYRGHCGTECELWIERAIQDLKNLLNKKVVKEPAKVIANRVLTKMAGNVYASAHNCRSLDVISGTGTSRELYESVSDETTGDDFPERDLPDHPLSYYKGRYSWSG